VISRVVGAPGRRAGLQVGDVVQTQFVAVTPPANG
jgi:hypothetical protein